MITDESNLYTKLGRKFEGGHKVVRHKWRQYVKPGTDIHWKAAGISAVSRESSISCSDGELMLSGFALAESAAWSIVQATAEASVWIGVRLVTICWQTVFGLYS